MKEGGRRIGLEMGSVGMGEREKDRDGDRWRDREQEDVLTLLRPPQKRSHGCRCAQYLPPACLLDVIMELHGVQTANLLPWLHLWVCVCICTCL